MILVTAGMAAKWMMARDQEMRGQPSACIAKRETLRRLLWYAVAL